MIDRSRKNSSFIKIVGAIALTLSALMLPGCQLGGERSEEREGVEERRENIGEEREGVDERRENIGEERKDADEGREGSNREDD
ncbi:MAG: hypothetical protein KME17_28090 [Cyanosarcina radialis HA8281-LM2]|jgi:hypothetical protein|nr:hypothetical protein [Cyanosarcina radialis HA8281-LM2]